MRDGDPGENNPPEDDTSAVRASSKVESLETDLMDGDLIGPRAIRWRHRQERKPTRGEAFLRQLSAEEARWLEAMTARVAALYHVESDDLLQELRLAILRCDTLDDGRTGYRSWLTQMAIWRACDEIRREVKHRSHTIRLDDRASDLPAREPVKPNLDWDVRESWQLTRDEAQVVRLLCWGLDISMRDYAVVAERPYATVRKHRSRGLRKIEALFHLTAEQRAALIACRKHGSYDAAAVSLGREEKDVRRLVGEADRKIQLALEHPDPDDTIYNNYLNDPDDKGEGSSDEC